MWTWLRHPYTCSSKPDSRAQYPLLTPFKQNIKKKTTKFYKLLENYNKLFILETLKLIEKNNVMCLLRVSYFLIIYTWPISFIILWCYCKETIRKSRCNTYWMLISREMSPAVMKCPRLRHASPRVGFPYCLKSIFCITLMGTEYRSRKYFLEIQMQRTKNYFLQEKYKVYTNQLQKILST